MSGRRVWLMYWVLRSYAGALRVAPFTAQAAKMRKENTHEYRPRTEISCLIRPSRLRSILHSFPNPLFFSGGVDRDIYEAGFFSLHPHSRSISSLFLRCGVLHTKGHDEVRIIAWTTKMSDWTILRTILKRYLTAWHREVQNLPRVTLVTDPAYASDNTLTYLLPLSASNRPRHGMA